MEINYSKLCKEAREPFQANESDAGYDLFSTQYITIEPFQRKLVSTGISVEIPHEVSQPKYQCLQVFVEKALWLCIGLKKDHNLRPIRLLGMVRVPLCKVLSN